MSRYLILIILNVPLILAGIMNTIVVHKLGRTSKRRFVLKLTIWILILASLIFAKPIYDFLFNNQLTDTEPLSLFDVMQITGIILTFLIANQAYSKADILEHRVQDLHQELSIRLSQDEERDSKRK